MRKSNFALRLQPSLLDEARRSADEEGVALNQLIDVAVAEKLSAIRTRSRFSVSGRVMRISGKQSRFWDGWGKATLRRKEMNSRSLRSFTLPEPAAGSERNKPEQRELVRVPGGRSNGLHSKAKAAMATVGSQTRTT